MVTSDNCTTIRRNFAGVLPPRTCLICLTLKSRADLNRILCSTTNFHALLNELTSPQLEILWYYCLTDWSVNFSVSHLTISTYSEKRFRCLSETAGLFWYFSTILRASLIANLIGGMSVINNLFGNKELSIPEIAIIFYTFVALYIAGNMLIKKGDEIWVFIYFGLYLQQEL